MYSKSDEGAFLNYIQDIKKAADKFKNNQNKHFIFSKTQNFESDHTRFQTKWQMSKFGKLI